MRKITLLLTLLVLFPLGFADGQTKGKKGESIEIEEEYEFKMGDPELDVLWINEKNGEYLPLTAVFNDERGTPVTLGEIIDRPTLLLPIYFYCPSSCSTNLVNLATAIKRSNWRPGNDFKIIAFSFNEEEDDEDARVAKRNYLRLLPKNFSAGDWKFLTGSQKSITEIIESIGYTYKPMKDGTFIHPSALITADGTGRIIKYVYGSFISGDVDIAIAEAIKGEPALSVRRLLGYCFNYDPQKSRSFFRNLKFAVILGFALCGVLFFFFLRRSTKKNNTNADRQTGESS